jgi:4a-hydroxytetrahydrobiopterin dehydratase
MMNLKEKQCVPCRAGMPPLSNQEEDRLKKEVPSWTLTRGKIHQLKKSYKFSDFRKAMTFVNRVADLANSEDHHPDICIHYNRVDLTLFTHKIGGLHENDFILASKIDGIERNL